jgi:hypothetical protein
LPTADGPQSFARGDRLQIIGTDKRAGLYNGMIGTVQEIEDTRITLKLDGRREDIRTFDAENFQKFGHGYAGTIYKGQGRTLDQSYLYHSEHWRSAASYVALTRHRDKAELFVARNTARDLTQLARQMARVDDRRAASHFYPVGPVAGLLDDQDVAAWDRAPQPEQFRTKPRVDREMDWTSHGGMVEQQRSALDWVKDAQKQKSARTEQTDRMQETSDAERGRTEKRAARIRDLGREIEEELDDELDLGRERSR